MGKIKKKTWARQHGRGLTGHDLTYRELPRVSDHILGETPLLRMYNVSHKRMIAGLAARPLYLGTWASVCHYSPP